MNLQTLSSNGAIVHKNKMYDLYIDQKLVDTKLVLSDGSIKVHGIVLATESKPACKLMDSMPGPWRTLKWTQYSKEVMRLVIEFIYRGTVIYPRHLETQIKSVTKFLQLEGISIKKTHTSSKCKIESFGTTHDLITNIKPEEEVIEISDEECSINNIISQSPTKSIPEAPIDKIQHQSPPKSIPEAPIDKIQHQTNSLCSPVPQNQDQCKSSDENLSDTTFYESLSENEMKSADKIESVIPAIPNKPLEANNANNSTFFSLTYDTCLSIPPKENDFAIPSKPLEANNSSNGTFLSLTPNTCLSPQLKQSELLEKQIFRKDEYFDDSLPNLKSNKNPYAKMIRKNVPATKKILNFLTEPNDNVIQDDNVAENPLTKEVEDISENLQVTTEESTRNATNQKIQSKISIISQHIITTSDQEDELPFISIRKERLGNFNKEISHNLRESLDSSPPATQKFTKNKYDQLPFNKEQISTKTTKKRKRISNRLSNKHCDQEKNNVKATKLCNKQCDQEKNNIKATKLSLKYCLLCDQVKKNFRNHLKYNHKEVFRKPSFMCDKCFTTFYFEFFKNNHNCE